MNYGFEHEGKVYGPAGLIQDTEGRPLSANDTEAYNKALEAKEIEWLKTAPDKVFAYVKMNFQTRPTWGVTGKVSTWLGTVLAESAWIGNRAYVGFGFNTYRRPIRCRIFGVLYHGWYFESSGDYCRLKKAKRQ